MRVLAGDIGGTHARLAIFRVDLRGGERENVREHVYDSPDYEGLEPIVREFLDSLDEDPPESACLGIACPVHDGVCHLPNLDWEIDTRRFGESLPLERVRLINDFDAVGHSLSLLGPEDLEVLQEGEEDPEGAVAVLGAGTGLGVAYLVPSHDPDARGRRVLASEGGHADYAPRTELEDALLRHLRERYGHVSYERVVSGPGLVEVYRFLAEREPAAESAEARREISGGDPAAAISRLGLEGSDPLCSRALEIFVRGFGAHAGNLALLFRASGGVYLAGGIAPKILEALRNGPFLPAFREKGRLSELVKSVPVRVITNTDAGLIGAASAAARL